MHAPIYLLNRYLNNVEEVFEKMLIMHIKMLIKHLKKYILNKYLKDVEQIFEN